MEIINLPFLYDYWLKPKRSSSGGIFEGKVVIHHSFDKKSRKLFNSNHIKSTFCEETYDVRITFNDTIGVELKLLNPPNFLTRWIGYHIYPDWSCCFCAPQELRKIQIDWYVDAKKILTEHIIPFLYDQTYYVKNKDWIIWEYGHGDIWTIERYWKEEYLSQEFTILTLNSLTQSWLQIFLAWWIHAGKKETDYYNGLALLRKYSAKILPLNLK